MEAFQQDYDLIIVGGGGAALTAAAVASEAALAVLLVSKDPVGCSDTKISEGGITVMGSGDRGDSIQSLYDNIRIRGHDLSDVEITKAFAVETQRAYQWLRRQGIRPLAGRDGQGPETYPVAIGGHDRARAVRHPNGGLSFIHTLLGALRERAYDLVQDAWFLDVLVEDQGERTRRVAGGLVYLASRGILLSIRARAVLLATGGASTLYFPNTDTMRGNTGDGYAVTLRAGATLVDMEQVQFIPFALTRPRSMKGLFLGEPVSAGPLGVLRDRHGDVLLKGLMYRTRADIAGVMGEAVAQGRGTESGGCFLDLTQNVRGFSGEIYQRLMKRQMAGPLKLVREALGEEASRLKVPWEVQPSAHYFMGGILVDSWGRSSGRGSVAGLFAAGQAMGGLHGSDRLGGNSLAEIIIFGGRAAKAAAEYVSTLEPLESKAFSLLSREIVERYRAMIGRDGVHRPGELTRELQHAAWKGIGPARTREGMASVLEAIGRIRARLPHTGIGPSEIWNQEFIDQIELENLLLSAEAVTLSALHRETSLGAHYRLDSKRERARGMPPFSICASGRGGGLEITQLSRKKTSPWKRGKDTARSILRQGGLDFLRRCPWTLRDRILTHMYARLALRGRT